jgi:glycolate oxidase FAD binding subunit
VITARAGPPIQEVESVLAERGQMLGFEPPHFAGGATIGGAIASGLAGPRRAFSGAPRDFVLGVRIVNGRGEQLRFGGEVIKNVAGYDVSRLMAGAMGTLGVLLEVSLKVIPMPRAETTVAIECDDKHAIGAIETLARRPSPLSATCYDGRVLTLRLSGTESAIAATARAIGGAARDDGPAFWRSLRDQTHRFFSSDQPLWRLSVPAAAALPDLPGSVLTEWGGAQRWLHGDIDAESIRQRATAAGGHATLFRCGDRAGDVFHPLPATLLALHFRLKQSFDPSGILNPGRLYNGF